MAGANQVYKTGQVIFNQGDAADGMYLVRKGELQVFLKKDGNEVHLASITTGGMIGEMAFFDQKPRSASVKAASDSEVTKITAEDFGKLMKQIPKWFVSLMSSLSTRLRDTNERLQKLENQKAGAKVPYEDCTRILHVLNLLFKDAPKEGKSWLLIRAATEQQLCEIFNLHKKYLTDLFNALVEQKTLSIQQDNYKNNCLATANRGVIPLLTSFISQFAKNNPGKTSIPASAIEMLDCLKKLVDESAYDTVTIGLDDVIKEGDRNALETKSWQNDMAYFKTGSDALTLVKVSSGVGFKANKKELPNLIRHYRVLAALAKSGLT